ncbi:MAG: dihydrofolate reductase, partial [Flavobacteriaceae bacterium]|nr:dihydrofolate reductase [Flavobacteriaceae bacterium]
RRIKQKRQLYIHFVIFIIGAVVLIVANIGLGIGEEFKIWGIDWFVYAVILWLVLFVYHFINVFITHKFMGKDWEQQQLNKLVAKQKEKLDKLSKQVQAQYPVYTQDEQAQAEESGNREVTIIVAAGEDNSIGKDKKLLWDLPDDMQRFKKLTTGHHIIMGRITFETFKKPLPNRTHVVITRQSDYKVPDGVHVVPNLRDAMAIAKDDDQPFIIGGGEIYNQAMPIADKIEITRVHEKFDGDTFFPEISSYKWKEVERQYHPMDSKHEHAFTYITYKRVT